MKKHLPEGKLCSEICGTCDFYHESGGSMSCRLTGYSMNSRYNGACGSWRSGSSQKICGTCGFFRERDGRMSCGLTGYSMNSRYGTACSSWRQ